MNHCTQFAALTYILSQKGCLSLPFTLSIIDESREAERASTERDNIKAGLTDVQQQYLHDYYNGDSVDAVADEVFVVEAAGEAHLGSIHMLYDNRGEVLQVFAISY